MPSAEAASRTDPDQAPALPVARVAVDVSLSHLDRPFDYAVTAKQDVVAVPGARVRVRFAGKLRDGFILERTDHTDHQGALAPLNRVISPEPVLSPEVARLIRAVADHYAGSFADVMRLAVPPRHAATEKAVPKQRPSTEPQSGPSALTHYPDGAGFLAALEQGHRPRAGWQVVPSDSGPGDWASGFAAAAAASVSAGRGALAVVPDQRDLAQLIEACTATFGRHNFAVLTAELGPAARYRAFLSVLRGDVSVVIGTRAAAFAPVRRLGLVALWDDGNDLLSEPRAPYPHARDVLLLRAAHSQSAVLFAGYARSAETQQLVERGWLRELAADRPTVRRWAPRVRVSADSDYALERDPWARSARLPHEVFDLVRSSLPQGPVLIQVPRSGYLLALACADCREPIRCPQCSGPVRAGGDGGQSLECRWCARLLPDWRCEQCGSRRWRAPVLGATRTAEELGRAFPGTTIRQSGAGKTIDVVPDQPALVVTTPGAEPPAANGYAAAILLDTSLLLGRADLRAAEEALRRWLTVMALVRDGERGGTVLAVGESAERALQALVRIDPAGFAGRELAERAEAHFPPAAKLITVEGSPAALAEFTQIARFPPVTEILGPVQLPRTSAEDEPLSRLLVRSPLADGAALVKAVKEVLSIRSARKSEGALRVRVDPVVVG